MMDSMRNRATEAECQTAIIQAAKLGGWLVHAERPAMRQSGRWSTPIQGHSGFPDLVLVKGSWVLVVELKRKPNKIEDSQRRWLDAFAQTSVIPLVVWVPEQQREFCEALMGDTTGYLLEHGWPT